MPFSKRISAAITFAATFEPAWWCRGDSEWGDEQHALMLGTAQSREPHWRSADAAFAPKMPQSDTTIPNADNRCTGVVVMLGLTGKASPTFEYERVRRRGIWCTRPLQASACLGPLIRVHLIVLHLDIALARNDSPCACRRESTHGRGRREVHRPRGETLAP